MIIQLENGLKLEVQDGATPEQIDEVIGHVSQTQPEALKGVPPQPAPIQNGKVQSSPAQGDAAGPKTAAAYGAADMIPFGNTITSAIGAGVAKASGSPESFGSLYNQAKLNTSSTESANPEATLAGNVLGIGASLPLAGPAVRAISKGVNAIPGASRVGTAVSDLVGGSKTGRGLLQVGKGAAMASPVGAMYGADSAKPGEELAGAREGALVGAGAGALVPVAGGLARGIASTVSPKIDATTAALAQRAKDLGVSLRLDQISPTRVRKTVQKVSQELPLSGVEAQEESQLKQYMSAVAATIGQKADNLGPETITKFIGDARTKFEKAIGKGEFQVTAEDLKKVDALEANLGKNVTGEIADIVKAHTQQLKDDLTNVAKKETVATGMDASGFPITKVATVGQESSIGAKKLASLRSDLITSLPSIDSKARPHVAELVDVIDEIAERNATPEQIKAIRQARLEWRNFKTLEPLLEKSTDGNINPVELMQKVASSKFIKASRTPIGKDDLVDLARIGKKFMPKLGGSDTTQKAALVLAAKKATTVGGTLGTAAVIGPVKTAAALAANRGLQKLNNNQKLVGRAVKRGGSKLLNPPQNLLGKP